MAKVVIDHPLVDKVNAERIARGLQPLSIPEVIKASADPHRPQDDLVFAWLCNYVPPAPEKPEPVKAKEPPRMPDMPSHREPERDSSSGLGTALLSAGLGLAIGALLDE